MDICTPYAWADIGKIEKNIEKMTNGLKSAGILHRPHIKAHKSVEIAQKQIGAGAVGITVAKLSEAEVMADGGIRDIFIAYPLLGEKNLDRLKRLIKKAEIRTIIDSVTVAEGLSSIGMQGNVPVEVLVEIDAGAHRGGIQPGSELVEFVHKAKKLPGIRIVGIMDYMGQIYSSHSIEEIKKTAAFEAEFLTDQKKLLKDSGFGISIVSGGSTPAGLFPGEQRNLTESRAGNYIFYDANAILLGVAQEEECALKIRTTVVSTPLPGCASIDAGSKTLSSDTSLSGTGFGYVCGKPGIRVEKLNEEHGYLRYDPEKYEISLKEVVDVINGLGARVVR